MSGVLACLDRPPPAGEPPQVFNIGNNRGELVSELVRLLEASLGRAASVQVADRPVADVAETLADLSAIERHAGYRPTTPLSDGVPRFAEWFLRHHAADGDFPLDPSSL